MQYHHKLLSNGSQILATLPLAIAALKCYKYFSTPRQFSRWVIELKNGHDSRLGCAWLVFGSWNDQTQLESEVKKINIIPQRRQIFYFQHPVLTAKQSSITKFLSYTCNLLHIQAKFIYRAVFCAFQLENFLTVFYKIETKSPKMNFSSGASQLNWNFFSRKTLH